MNKIKLWFLKIFRFYLGILIFFTLLAVTLIVISVIGQRSLLIKTVPIEKKFQANLSEKLLVESVLIKGNQILAAGFRPQHSNAFITNYHVTKSVCRNLQCPDVKIQYADWNEFKEFPLQVHYCSKWLDICVLSPQGDSLDLLEESQSIDNINEVSILAHPDKRFTQNLEVINGTFDKRSGPFLYFKLTSQHGYSGSPIYSLTGQEVAIITSFGQVSSIEAISILIHYTLFGWSSSSNTKAIDYSVIISMLRSPNQFSHEVQLFAEYLRDSLSLYDNLGLFRKYFFLAEYYDAKAELCSKSVSEDEFSRMFSSFCFATGNLKLQSVEILKKLEENSTLKYLLEVDSKLRAESDLFD